MQYRRLGTSGLKVSSLCLGAMTFGEADAQSFMHGVSADESTSFRIMDRARESGINFIDTADVYGQDGLSERVVGRYLTERRVRDEVVLATKFRFRMWDGANGTGASRYRIVRCVEDSLRRLGTDRIDLYQIHMQDLETEEEETLRALDDLVRAGKVLYLGCSNYTAYRLTESEMLSRMHGISRFVSLQAQYSLAVRELEREHVPLCDRFGVGILSWSPLAGGFLSGKYRREGDGTGGRLGVGRWQATYQRLANERGFRIIDALVAMSESTGQSPSRLALAWVLAKRAVSSVIFGARTVQQLEDNLGAADLVLTPEQLRTLDEASAFELGYPYDFLLRSQGGW